jgi:hypothetical protein
VPPLRRTPRATERTAGTTRTTTRTSRTTTGTGTRTPRRRAAAAVPEHPTPADMPLHTPTEKVPGVTPPADEDLPGPDSAS